jgi:hypothetical protein
VVVAFFTNSAYQAGPPGRQVFVADEVFQPLQGRRRLAGQDIGAGLGQLLAHIAVDDGRDAPERRAQRAVDQVLAHFAQHGGQRAYRHLRLGPAGAHPFAHLLYQAIHVVGQGGDAVDVVAVVVLGIEGHLRGQLRQADVDAVLCGNRLGVDRTQLRDGDAPRLVVDEQVIRDAVLALQLLAVDPADRLEHALFVRLFLPARGERGVGQRSVVAVVADRGRVLGMVSHAPLPVAIEQRVRLVGRRLGACRQRG